ncbi:MAG: transporter substrate-binding domain-containing protein [Caldisericia bacterium]|jgi:polar amino acid transport system substrate-binding protein|nr:transporter substrate-binding domain-containing protein [Caldisericia bacterium]
MFKKLLLMILLISFFVIFISCRRGSEVTLLGVVKDENGKPLSGVVVNLDSLSATTNNNGEFEFKNLEERAYNLNVNFEGYYPISQTVNLSKGENNLNLTLRMTTLTKARNRGYLLVGSDVTYPPFEYMENGKPVGFDIDLINLIAQEMGLNGAQIIDTAWDGIFAALKTEKFDVIISSVTITEDRKKEMLFSDPYYDSGQIIAVRKDDTRINNENDLVGKIVGVQINTTGDFTAQKIQGIKEIKRYDDIQQAFQDLELGRIDAVLNDLPVNAWFAKERKNVKLVGKLLTVEQYGICARLEDQTLIDEINRALKNLRESGKYREVYVKWFGVEPPQK